MRFFTANLLGDLDATLWNAKVADPYDDEVYILGGVGQMSRLKSFNGRKILLMSGAEMLVYQAWLTDSRFPDDEISWELYESILKKEFGIYRISRFGVVTLRSLTGNLWRVTSGKYIQDGMFQLIGVGKGENCINVSMTTDKVPYSERDIIQLVRGGCLGDGSEVCKGVDGR